MRPTGWTFDAAGLAASIAAMKTRFALRLLAAALVVAGFAGCSSMPELTGDAALAADVRARLSSDAVTDRCNIGVSVSDGVVTLSGNVPDTGTKARAKDVVRGTEGIKGVVDNLNSR